MDELRKQVNGLREGFEALNKLLEKERKINEIYEYNVKRTSDLSDCSKNMQLKMLKVISVCN